MGDAARHPNPVRARLLEAALHCFLADDYHNVTTRMLAEQANSNVAMIRYYFGSKGGLYEEMIRDTLSPLVNAFESHISFASPNLADFLRLYYSTMSKYPAFPKLILKVLALNDGPGKRFIQQLLERARTRGLQKLNDLKARENLAMPVDPEILRMSFVCLAITPMLIKEIFEEQMERELDAQFLDGLASFNGLLFSTALASFKKGTAGLRQ